MNPVDKARRTVAVADMLQAGCTTVAILKIFPDYSETRLSVIRKYLGITTKRGRKVGSVSAKTAAAVKFLASPSHNGMTRAEIGRKFKVSRQRIYQIEYPDKHRRRVARWQARLKAARSKTHGKTRLNGDAKRGSNIHSKTSAAGTAR